MSFDAVAQPPTARAKHSAAAVVFSSMIRFPACCVQRGCRRTCWKSATYELDICEHRRAQAHGLTLRTFHPGTFARMVRCCAWRATARRRRSWARYCCP
jgi:hypothetical protein